MFVNDGFARFSKVLILISVAVVLIISPDYLRSRKLLNFEYPILIALSVVGMMVMVSSGDLMSLYMGLNYNRSAFMFWHQCVDSLKSTEAGLKYFVLGALSSGLLSMGLLFATVMPARQILGLLPPQAITVPKSGC